MKIISASILALSIVSPVAAHAQAVPPGTQMPSMTEPAFVPIDKETFDEIEAQILDRMPTRQGEPIHQALQYLEQRAKQKVEAHEAETRRAAEAQKKPHEMPTAPAPKPAMPFATPAAPEPKK
jgi:hypothetical protein